MLSLSGISLARAHGGVTVVNGYMIDPLVGIVEIVDDMEVLIGQTFGNWTILGLAGQRKNSSGRLGERIWSCRCKCGNKSCVRTWQLTSGRSQSCGCLAAKANTKRLFKHGESRRSKSGATPEYSAWRSAKDRCLNPSSKDYWYYGGRGIKMCERWIVSYPSFLEDMGRKPSPTHSLDRINNNGDYELVNCRWATPEEQQANRRSVAKLEAEVKRLQGIIQSYVDRYGRL